MLILVVHKTQSNHKKKAVIIGGGPAGLIAAISLAPFFEVHLFEQNKTLGRKFLVAGKGGFNLTNDKNKTILAEYYQPKDFFKKTFENFDVTSTRDWLYSIGTETYVGSSGRVFPNKGTKPIEVLNAIKKEALEVGVQLHLEHRFIDFSENEITVVNKSGNQTLAFDYAVFALGGGSWSKTGSDGKWLSIFSGKGIETVPFQASNCGIEIDFPPTLNSFIGHPLKNISISCGNFSVKGEALITHYGLEGNAIYPTARVVREELSKNKKTTLKIDFKPFNTLVELENKISSSTHQKNYGYLFKLSKVQLALLKAYTDKETYLSPKLFVKKIKNLEIPVQGLRPVDEAISTVGGIPINEMHTDFSLKKFPNIYIAGEMFDWDTITGGYLLQGCFSSGHFAAQNIIEKESQY